MCLSVLIPACRIALENIPCKFYYYSMKKKVTDEMVRLVFEKFGSAGGKARAKKYDRETLRKWARMGGRPRKNSQTKSTKRG